MLKDGTYSAWFKTPLGEGTGIVHLADGRLWGRDSVMFYDGSYETAGDSFKGILRTKRHTPNQPTLFGMEELELKIEGTTHGKIATYIATTDAVPGMIMEGRLIPNQSQPAVTETPRASTFDARRLPRLPKRSR
jgi:hypothetical protein